ncbi:3-oxoacyl-[acyl-carrier-protein] reductase [soil metagenome]
MTGNGRVALVTGGSGAIGAATARVLAAAGQRVAIGYGRDLPAAEHAVKQIEADGGAAVTVQVDVADRASVDAAFDHVEQALGPVEVLVNAAGINRDGLLLRMSDEAWGDVIATDLTGAFHTIRRALGPMVRARFGRIVNVASVVGSAGSAGQANYAAAKAGLIGLTRSVAREVASRSITANVVEPGPIVSAMTEALPEQRRQDMADLVPLGRFGTPEEAAAVVAFLCSEPAGYVTGAVLPVDGGLGMGR